MSHPLDNMTEPELRTLINDICRTVKGKLPPQTGFVILFSPFGSHGISQYGSNVKREDMIAHLREAADRLENLEDVTR